MSEINDTKESPEGIFSINLKIINQHQYQEPILKATYNIGTYQKGYFSGESYIKLNLVTCEGNIVIPLILKRYVLHWYHAYLLHTGIDRTKVFDYPVYVLDRHQKIHLEGSNYL